MTSKHTPGPWKAEVGPCGTRTGLLSETTGRPVCMLGITSALNPADVALIEQAPVMLGTLEELAHRLEQHSTQLYARGIWEYQEELKTWIAVIRDLIRDAKSGAA